LQAGGRSRVHRAVESGRGRSGQPAAPADQASPYGFVRRLSPDPSSGRRGREFKSPSPDHKRPGQKRYSALRADSLQPRFPTNVVRIAAREGSQAVQGWRLAAHGQRPRPGHGQAPADLRDGGPRVLPSSLIPLLVGDDADWRSRGDGTGSTALDRGRRCRDRLDGKLTVTSLLLRVWIGLAEDEEVDDVAGDGADGVVVE
jgi:hypothetical protein